MQVTVLHLQDDLDAVRIARILKTISDIRVCITPKYGKFSKAEAENCIKRSQKVFLLILDRLVEFDKKTLEEIKIVKKLRKKLVVVAPRGYDLPDEVIKYSHTKVIFLKDVKQALEEIKNYIRKKRYTRLDRFEYVMLSVLLFQMPLNAR